MRDRRSTLDTIAARHAACTAGLRAGMEPADPRVVPPEFASSSALAEVWLNAYDSQLTALQCQRPGIMEVSSEREPKPRETPPKAPRARKKSKEVKIQPAPETPAAPAVTPTMMAILNNFHPEGLDANV